MTTGRVTVTSVNWDENIKALRDFKNVLKTSMGPEGCVKVLVTGGDVLQVTSTSSSLIARLDLEHPICRYIGHVVHGLPDYGLYFGVMVSDLVEQLWLDESISNLKLHTSAQTLLEFVQQILASNVVCKKVDFSSVSSFLPLVRTVISSKCSNLIFNIDINRFCIEIVKAFLNCVDDRTNSVGKVIVKVKTGPNSVSSHNGILYQITEEHDIKNIREIKGILKVLIFRIKLDNTENKNEIPVIDQVMPILEQAVQSNVRLVGVQKTVANEIKMYLMRKKVILMDRMGTTLTDNLINMSKAFPLSESGVDNFSDIDRIAGTLTSIEHIEFNESNYILLKNSDFSISTVLIQSYCLAGTDHLEALTQQAISSLRLLALHPVLTFGGGCLEVWLIAQIHILKESHNDKEFLKLLNWVQKSLLSACSLTRLDSVDSVYHHGWAKEGLRCKCGLVTEEELNKVEGLLIPLAELVNTESVGHLKLNPPRQSTAAVLPDVLVDSHKQKVDVIVSVIETFANIADIGFIMFKD